MADTNKKALSITEQDNIAEAVLRIVAAYPDVPVCWLRGAESLLSPRTSTPVQQSKSQCLSVQKPSDNRSLHRI